MAGASARYAYVSDDGSTYSIKMDISNALAAGNTPDSTSPGIRHGYHPRYVLASHPTTGAERKIYIGEADNEIFVGPGTSTISLVDFGSTPSVTTTYNIRSRVGEKRYNQ
jgi:hypothetical protein